jgi:serine/threonine-protein kinase RsbW
MDELCCPRPRRCPLAPLSGWEHRYAGPGCRDASRARSRPRDADASRCHTPVWVAVDDLLAAGRAANGRSSADQCSTPVLHLELRLPRQADSVGLARRILGSVLQAMAVDQDCRSELLLALGEGCANVVQHAVGADGYEVRVSFDDDCCVVDITDNGRGMRFPINPSMPEVTAERGRGLSVMAMSTDSLQISPRRPHGLAVRFTKRLISP